MKKYWKPEDGVDESITDETISKKVSSLLNEYLNIDSVKEAVLCIKELRNPGKHQLVVEKMIEKAMDNQPEKNQLKIADLMAHMRRVKPYLLTDEQIESAFAFIDEIIDDLVVDFPKAREVNETLKKRLQLKGVLPDYSKKFLLSTTFQGAKKGYDYKMGPQGMGYYLQTGLGPATSSSADSDASPKAAKINPFGDAKPVSTTAAEKRPPTKSAPAAKKSNPFGDAKPVDVKTKFAERETPPSAKSAPAARKKVNPFGDAKPIEVKEPKGKSDAPAAPQQRRDDPFGGARPVDTKPSERDREKPKPRAKIDPFGGARPVNARPSATNERRKRSDPFGGARPVDTKPSERDTEKPKPRAKIDPFGGARPVETRQPSGGRDREKPKPRAKIDPFGGARPVDIKQPSASRASVGEADAKKKKKKKKKKGYQA
jgi:hypothetical protein